MFAMILPWPRGLSYLNLKATIVSSLIAIAVFVFKLFSVVLKFPDDPTSILALRVSPSLNNETLLHDYLDVSNYVIVISDENGFIGKSLYGFTVDYLAYALVLFSAFLWLLYVGKKKRKN
ncbi:hypothetical protein Q4498_14205 [Neptunomonas phycophila]|uniref:hypothetical protein n=1 Tax=Neptunomonas phycophila TaxID=1572645 RepID=UPI0026E154C8|nr:hypothetical protein [Neptunomonas phycophila]MDO6469264.1 hypothetical protein [Neptunomonas phycophila]